MLAGHDDAATQAGASEPHATERMEASLNEAQPPPASCGPRPLGESVAAQSASAGAAEVEVEVVPSEEDEPTDGVEVVEDCDYEQIVLVGCEQLVLQKSALNATGYLCVVQSERDGRYRVESASHAGISFPTARAAAVAYARIIAAEDESEPELDEDEIARSVQAAEEEVARGDDGCARAREMVRQPVEAAEITDADEEEQVQEACTEAEGLTAAEAVRQAGAEGLTLELSATSSSGYRGVQVAPSDHFVAIIRRDGRRVHLGTFGTAEEAALMVARDAREHPVEVEETLTAA